MPISFRNSAPTNPPPLPIPRHRTPDRACIRALAPALSTAISFLPSTRFQVLLATPPLSNLTTVPSLLSILVLLTLFPPLLLHLTVSTSPLRLKISVPVSLPLNPLWVTQSLNLQQVSRLLLRPWRKLEHPNLELEVLHLVNFVRGLLPYRNRLLSLPTSRIWLLSLLLPLLTVKCRARRQCLEQCRSMKLDGMESVVIRRLVKEVQEETRDCRRMEKGTTKRGGQTMKLKGSSLGRGKGRLHLRE